MTTTLVWDNIVSQPNQAPNNDGQEGIEIYGNFLYATDFIGSNIDTYQIDDESGEFTYVNSFGSKGTGIEEFGEFSPVDISFYQLEGNKVKAYLPDATNQRLVVLDVDQTSGALSWDNVNTLPNATAELSEPYGIEIIGDFLYSTDYGGSDIDIYQIDAQTGGLSYLESFGSEGEGVDQFSGGSPVDISFYQQKATTKAYVPDAENQRIVVLDVDTTTGKLSWDEALTLPKDEVNNGLQYGLEIHEDQLYVTDYGDSNIDLYNINPETGGLSYSNTVGSNGNGIEQFETPVDLAFYTTTDEVTRAYVPDSGNQRIAALKVVDSEVTNTGHGLVQLEGMGDTQLTLSLNQNSTAGISEVVAISTDNPAGTIDGIAIGEAGYLQAAQSRSQVIFSVLEGAGFTDLAPQRTVDVSLGSFLNFAVIKGGSLQEAIQDNAQVDVTFGSQIVRTSELDNSLRSDSANTQFDLIVGASAGADIVLTVELGDRAKAIGTALQDGSAESELFDLTNETGTLTAQFDVYREASFDSLIGFFAVENAQGDIRSDSGELLSVNDEGYTKAALAKRLDIELTARNGEMSSFTTEVDGGQILASYLIVDGTLDSLTNDSSSDDATIYFTHIGANSDGADHVKLLGDNTFGFEDMKGGGDKDFNDLVIKATFA